ncbi:uncharacterized protein LOC127834639 isoform X2 [Dreissena polymorpha]|uniref:uncharacterized protein LOC127834639 isoform X2 n=1 Tax=Dreissena polymorpha TaxID=45954 RepID=UPI0022649B1C|nr:uncharacterized protein LOC127834639 isoform X2 [Dreissena polymorpha]
MATVKLCDSNRDSAGDFIGECSVTQSCEPCMKTNVSKTATVFCKDCNEFLCDACKNPHTVYKSGKHDIVNSHDRKSLLLGVDMKGMDKCQEHDKEIEFFCHDHAKLCCSKCVLIHRKCDLLDEIANVCGQKRHELQAVKQSLINLQSEADSIITDFKHSETGLNESISKISSEVDAMRDRIIKQFEDAKQKLITEANTFKTSEVRFIENMRDASSNIKEEILKEVSMCCSVLERGTPSQKYIYSTKMKDKLNTIESILNKQHSIKSSSTLTVSFPKEVTTFLEMGDSVVILNCDRNKTAETSPISLSSLPRPITLELLVSVNLSKTEDDDKEPYLTGLDFLPDGRLVAVDNYNCKCIILNELLQRLGLPYKFNTNPCDVVCLSSDECAATLGKGKLVCLLSVSKDNVIRLTRIINTTSKFYSISCMSPLRMVVSSYDDPRPVKMLSVDGAESDFDHVTFPVTTYKIDESMCTYVQSKNTSVLTDRDANKVFMYDTLNGTSRAVTNNNIREPCSACAGPNDTALVCSKNNHAIAHLTVDGDVLGFYPVDLKLPHSLCVSKDGTKLAVSNSATGAGKLQLYKISLAMS